MRSGDCGSAKQVHMTWEDATMNGGKQCLQRDVTAADVSRRCAGRTCLMFVEVLRRMMGTLQRSRLETNVSSPPTYCYSVTLLLRSELLFRPSFLVSLNALPGVLHAEWSTKRTTEPDTAQTERVLTRLVDTASLDSRLHQSSKRVFHNIHVLRRCMCRGLW